MTELIASLGWSYERDISAVILRTGRTRLTKQYSDGDQDQDGNYRDPCSEISLAAASEEEPCHAGIIAGHSPQENAVIPAMSEASIAKVRELTDLSLKHLPQYPFITKHRLHAGIYSRTVTIPELRSDGASLVTGVLVKRPTQLYICGEDVTVYMGEGIPPAKVHGLEVFLGLAGRKQAFLSRGPFTMAMSFATNAKTVEEAEAEFTDEIELLCPLSEADRHDIVVTEEVT